MEDEDEERKEVPSNEIQRLREENTRLKKTLVDKFHQEFDN